MKYKGHKLRHEYKYYIKEKTYHILRERFRSILQADENMLAEEGYLISSLYFDDIYNSALEEKIQGNRFRKKYRIRVYNHDDDLIKLECKAKYDNYIAKESATLTREEYDMILRDDYSFLLSREETVCKELYCLHQTKCLKPVTVVEYRREAYVLDAGNVRITFDKDISSSIYSLDMFSDEYVTSAVLDQGIMVLEVKYDDFMPKFIWQVIQSEGTLKSAISKFVLCRNKNRRVIQL